MAEWSKEVFSKNLKKYMELNNVSQKELAEVVGVAAPTVSEWLATKKFPRIDKIEIMANYFGILKSDLIEEKENKKPAISSERERKLMKLTELLDRYSEDDLAWVLQMLERFPPSEK